MGVLTTAGPVSIEEYLGNPVYRHCEYVDGQPIELNLGTKDHSRIQFQCCGILRDYFKAHPAGYGATELHCRLQVRGRTRFRQPDVAVVLGPDESAESRYLERAPDFVVEIRSPQDTVAAQLRKIEEYFDNGAKLAWLILPDERSVIIAEPGKQARTAVSGEVLDGSQLLPGLHVPVAELFA